MALTAGSKLGVYEITGLLGMGGMGEVYRARDTRLKRDVAIKVLPEVFARDAERLARFQREAEVLASLNHPNIAAIHGLEESAGTAALVLELVEGPTLADRLRDGALPPNEALPIAKQIAEALEAAHENGIVHRDLKPANVKVTADSRVKVLDFGLAKVFGEAAPNLALSNSPTMISAGSVPGMILGTAAYMSPEQARGKNVDKRTDVWALGIVLFEMLTGGPVFGGETTTDVLGAIVHKAPDWERLPAETPAGIRRLLRRCLAKEAHQRLHDIADARIEIEDALREPAGEAPAEVQKATSRSKIWIAATTLLAAITAIVSIAYFFRPVPDTPRVQFAVTLPENLTYASPLGGQYSSADPGEISPDGQHIAFTALDAATGKVLLYVRPIDSLEVRPLPGTEDAFYPFWSPDSRSLAFTAQGKLKRVDLSGGLQPQVICDSYSFSRGAWNRDDVIVISLTYWDGPLSRVSAEGGAPAPVTTLQPGESSHAFPQFLPDGKHFLYFAAGVEGAIYAGALDGGEPKLVQDGALTMAAYASGRLLFEREGQLWAQPFDLARLELTGEPEPVVETGRPDSTRPDSRSRFSRPVFSVSENGALTYRRNDSQPDRFLWIGHDGREIEPVLPPGDNTEPSLSPDGRKLAFARDGAIWTMDLEGGTPRKFTFDPEDGPSSVWSPDGRSIAFYSSRAAGPGLYRKDTDGVGSEELLLASRNLLAAYEWSKSGLTFFAQYPETAIDQDVFLLKPGAPEPQQLFHTRAFDADATVHPDGQWLAYASTETGRWEVYITTLAPSGAKKAVTNGGGVDPKWSRTGKELFYVHSVTGELMAVDVSTEDGIAIGKPRRIYKGPLTWGSLHSFAVAPDESRFLVWTFDPNPGDVTVLLNWPSLLQN